MGTPDTIHYVAEPLPARSKMPLLAVGLGHLQIGHMAPKLMDLSQLSVAERLQLVEDLRNNIDVEQILMPDWQRKELDRRLDDYRANPEAGIP